MKTQFIKEEIMKCEDIDELKAEVFPLLKSQQEEWSRKINEIIQESGLSKLKFAELIGVSRMAVNKWVNGAIPRNRESFLRIGMAAGYDQERMNQLLQRYGRYPELYAKSLEDCVCIYVLNNYQNSKDDPILKRYDYILGKIKESIIRNDDMTPDNISTKLMERKIGEVTSEDQLNAFISENIAVFASSYHRFYAYVMVNIEENYEYFAGENGGSVSDMALVQGWSSSLKQCVSAIRQKKWYPTRNKIISLGIHLCMDHEQIDDMLELAHMEPLCSKNIFESVIMFILEDASLNDMLDSENENFDVDELGKYARKVLEELNLPEVESFITELSGLEEEDE